MNFRQAIYPIIIIFLVALKRSPINDGGLFQSHHHVRDRGTGSVDNGDGSTTYMVKIRSPLREAVPAGTFVRFNRPRCLMRLAPGSSITADISAFWWSTPDVSFIESFGTI